MMFPSTFAGLGYFSLVMSTPIRFNFSILLNIADTYEQGLGIFLEPLLSLHRNNLQQYLEIALHLLLQLQQLH